MKKYKVAFIGFPNSGKSSWIAHLSNQKMRIGNWSGVSVEVIEVLVEYHKKEYLLVDLPGIYELYEGVNEALVTTDYLHNNFIDCIVNVIDESQLYRQLILTMQLRELNIPLILLINFKQSQSDLTWLDCSVYQPDKMSIIQKEELFELIEKNVLIHPDYSLLMSHEHQKIYLNIYCYLQEKLPLMDRQKRSTLVYDLICNRSHRINVDEIKKGLNQQQLMLDYEQIINQHVKKKEMKVSFLDKILLHKIAAYPLMLFFFWLMFALTFKVTRPWISYLEQFFNEFLRNLLFTYIQLPAVLLAMISDGILAGIGGILSFLPTLAVFYFFIAVLEESGYMARIMILSDRIMRFFKLSGKSFLYFIIGFGCNVPAILATRSMRNGNEKNKVALLIPFMSCSARLPIYLLFATAFFSDTILLTVFTIIGIGLLVAMILSLFFKEDDNDLFMIELPVYRFPSIKKLFKRVYYEVNSFVHKSFTIVLLSMLILWGISYFPSGDKESSYMAYAAKSASFIFEPAGFGTNWKVVASIPSGFVAKEGVIAYLSSMSSAQAKQIDFKKACEQQLSLLKVTTINSLSLHFQKEDEAVNLKQLFSDDLKAVRALAFMVYICLSVPCVSTLLALYHEFGYKMMLKSIIIMLILPYVTSVLLFQSLKWLIH